MSEDSAPSLEDAVTFLRERLSKAYGEGKHNDYMRHLAVVLAAAERSGRLDRENDSLTKYIYYVSSANVAGLTAIEKQLEMLALEVREIKNGYAPKRYTE